MSKKAIRTTASKSTSKKAVAKKSAAKKTTKRAKPKPVKVEKDLAEMTLSEKVIFISEKALEKDKANSPETAKSGRQVFQTAKGLFPKEVINETTFQQYLSISVREKRTAINCLGRKQGYYLSSAAKELFEKEEDLESEELTASDKKRIEKEKLLYPVLLNWLIEQDYRSKITGTGRGNGKWGNPDLVGINYDDAFGNFSLEIASIEVKLNEVLWRQWIFEAVSHRRFANRSYFAIAHPAELIKKLDPELRYFSELYGIGVLVITMDKALYDKLQAGKLKDDIKDDEVDIVELYSAPYSAVQPLYQKDFIQRLKIKSIPELSRWGEGLQKNEQEG